ncbi:hypothetical protein [Candidatus Nanosyncoccus alces]|uniref:Uncharacterized protein n=1 Tax=Candidatus Nanosyncoccus alces TaxID=2171997 RepID=A0ABY0FNK1_9BACT|nr:hypothetical protein [Candidatus Nanosyncoccus alces]RYC74828.1 hypothetical protein G3RUM_00377 [Candidatus Nanosyncoccus alces]
MRRKDDKDEPTERGLMSRIIEGVIVFAVLGFVIKLGVESILSVKIPLLIIAVICGAIVIGYRVYKHKRDHDDY